MAGKRKSEKSPNRTKKPEHLKQLLESFFDNKEHRHISYIKHMRMALKHFEQHQILTHAQLAAKIETLPAKLRREGVFVLQGVGRKSDAPLLIRMIKKDRSLRVRVSVADALGRISGVRANKALETAVMNPANPDRLRWGCLHQLTLETPEQQIGLFTDIAADPNEHPMIRGQAAEGIAYNGGGDRRRVIFKRAEEEMLKCLEDPHGEVRFWAMFALGRMKSRKALPKLKQLARTDKFVGTMRWRNSEEAKDAIEIIHGHCPEPDAFERQRGNPPQCEYYWPWSF